MIELCHEVDCEGIGQCPCRDWNKPEKNMKLEQLQEMRSSLINDLSEVLERHRQDIGVCLVASDIVGVLEFLKMQVCIEAFGDDLLDNTTLSLS